jgi:aryl-alcohol dehydrogenase-like predicted oxidoreductase
MDQRAVPGLGVGCSNFGSFADERASYEVVSAALDLGVGYFDTADAYPPGSPGLSERILGAVLKGRRDKATVAARVNPCEADLLGNHCVEVSSFGSLIHATVGRRGGWGGLRTNRSGWVA